MALPPNKFILRGSEGGVTGFGENQVFGDNSAQTLHLAANARATLDGSFARGNDIINIAGAAALYTANIVDGSIVLTAANGANILIPIGTNGTTINFGDGADDSRVLVAEVVGDAVVYSLGDQTIPGDGSGVGVTPADGGGEEPGVDGATIYLDVGRDVYETKAQGVTDDDDLFIADIAANQLGEQANTLSSGDRLDGLGGNDRLEAIVQDASALNAGPSSSIFPRLNSIETVHFNGQFADGGLDNTHDYDENPYGIAIGVEINAANTFGTKEWGSVGSDTSVTIYNVNTLNSGSRFGDEPGNPTNTLTVRMDHTGSASPNNDRANLTVLLDNDYLIRPGEVEQGGSLTLQLLDIDSYLGIGTDPGVNNRPLLSNPFDILVFNLTVDGTTQQFEIEYDPDNNLEGVAAYQALAQSMNSNLAAQGLAGRFVVTVGQQFSAVDPDDNNDTAFGYELILTNLGEGSLTADGFRASGVVPSNTDYQKEVFPTPPETDQDPISINIVLDKVGRGGDGGYLTVGGMAVVGMEHYVDSLIANTYKGGLIGEPGIEVFHVKVEGTSNEPSSLAGLQSTHNSLREVYVENPGSTAKLTIGNTQTISTTTINGALVSDSYYGEYPVTPGESVYTDSVYHDLTSVKNAAIKDVLIFDASAFTADSDVYAWFSDEVVAKYINLKDTAAPSADNQNALWTFGDGSNLVNVNFSKNNFAVLGNTVREDFTFSVETNGGDDHVQLQIGNGQGFEDGESSNYTWNTVDHWYANHAINSFQDYAETGKMQIDVDTGSGDDIVELWGSTVAHVVAGSGDDVVYTDNSGETDSMYNEGRAVWGFNNNDSHGHNIENLLSEVPASTTSRIANLGLVITFQGIESHVANVANTNSATGSLVTDLDINQAIKDAINNDAVLKNLLVAEDGPGRTLVVRSLIDGEHYDIDLGVSLVDTGSRSQSQINAGAILLSSSNAQANLIGFDSSGDPADGRFDSDFLGNFAMGGFFTGFDSWNVNNNVIEGGEGNDLIVLSSNGVGYGFDPNDYYPPYYGVSVETVVITQNMGNDTVVNFTAAVADGAIGEIQVIEFAGTVNDLVPAAGDPPVNQVDGEVTVTLPSPFNTSYTVVVDADAGSSTNPTTAAEIAAALAALINDDDTNEVVASATGGQLTLTYPVNDGTNYDDATVLLDPANAQNEEQSITISNTQVSPATVSVQLDASFYAPEITLSVGTGAADDDATEIAGLLATAINTAVGQTIATASGADVLLEYPGTEDYDLPVVGVFASGGNQVTLDIQANEGEDGAGPFGITYSRPEELQQDGQPGVPGWDIFDVTALIGPVVEVLNDKPVVNTSGGEDLGISDRGIDTDGGMINEVSAIAYAVHNDGIVYITDTVSPGDYAGTYANETARIDAIAKAADTNALESNQSIVITVDADNVGAFYLINNAAGAGNATATLLGTIELATYDVDGKEAIGAWDLMALPNFTPLTAQTVVDTFVIA